MVRVLLPTGRFATNASVIPRTLPVRVTRILLLVPVLKLSAPVLIESLSIYHISET